MHFRMAVAICLLAAPVCAGVKEDQHAQMIGLAQQMRELKIQGQAGTPAYSALRSQYNAISSAMGGDDPGSTVADGQPVVDGRRAEAPVGSVGVIPPAPAGCTLTTEIVTQNTPVVIPTTISVVTSTLNVAGAGTFLWDVNLQSFITHSFNADLDITIMSPAGTIVTLTSDNGSSFDNVFNGTVWDDQANPGGQVPYTSNNGVVSDDATYADGVVETTEVPEEAMSAFFGENPNGTWTLTISDDLGGDGGSVIWSLEHSTLPAAPAVLNFVASNNTPVVIPTTVSVVSSTIVVAGAGTSIVDLDLTSTIIHSFNADLDITVMSPAGTVVTLTSDNGSSFDNVFNGTVWNDQANPGGQVPYTSNDGVVSDNFTYADGVVETTQVPEEAMGAFIGEDPNGTWTLTLSDDLGGDGGSVTWSLDIDTGTCVIPCQITCPVDQNLGNDPNQCGAVVNFPAPITTGDCGPITCTPASGSFFPVATTPVTCQEGLLGAPQGGLVSCGFNVTVSDTQPPTETAPDLVVNTDPGVCTGTATPAATASDNCPGVTSVCTPPGPTFSLGITPVSCTATDASSNTATDGGGSVTVNDLEPPVITCPADINEDLPSGAVSGPASWLDPVVSDNCPGVGFPNCVPPSGSTFQADVLTPVSCTVLDAASNTGNCTFNVLLASVSIIGIPTASGWGLAGLALLLAGAAFLALRRRKA